MKINASINFIKTIPNNNITGHITRNPNHINNTNINSVISKYNFYYNMGQPTKSYGIGHYTGTDRTRNELLNKLDHQQYGDYIRKKNAKARNQHHLSYITTIKHYLNTGETHKHRTELAVTTLGTTARKKIDNAIFNKYYDTPKAKLTDRIRKAYSATLRQYGNNWNQRHKNLICIGFGTNIDEIKKHEGAPHIHLIIYNKSKTKRGYPSPSFSNAIKSETGIRDNRKALSAIHKTESQQLLNDCQNIFNQRFKKLNLHLKYQPTNSKITGLSMPQFKKLNQKQNHILSKQKNTIRKNEIRISKLQKQRENYRSSRNYFQYLPSPRLTTGGAKENKVFSDKSLELQKYE